MSENKKKWAKNCIWPAPIGELDGFDWDEDIIPFEIDEACQYLVDIKDYFDGLRNEGFLDEYYCLDNDFGDELDEESEEEFIPENGEEYWDGQQFDIELWREDLSAALNLIKIEACDPDPVSDIQGIINYHFINENLLRQAFTRRAFQIEYKLSGCNEELEFIGDSILSLFVTKEMMKHFSCTFTSNTEAPFKADYDEGEFSRLKSRFVCKEYLSSRCEELGLDKYILYGTGEEKNESAKEDVIEAIIGAVAIDSNWNSDALEEVIDRLIKIQVSNNDVRSSYYEILNAWHQRHFGCMPEYEIYKRAGKSQDLERVYDCVIKFDIPDNDKGIHTRKVFNNEGKTRSQARERAAGLAYDFLVKNGLWINLKDANVVPDCDNSINQLQEMYQKGYIEKTEYVFEEESRQWRCTAKVNNITGTGVAGSKVQAKKMAAYETVIHLLKAAGCCKEEWFSQMISIKYGRSDDVEVITAEYHGGLKYEGMVAVLEQIESGKVITEGVLLKWLGAAYGIDNLQINWREIPNVASRDNSICFHRFLTSKGLVNGWYKDKLLDEGHQVVETKTDNWRVLDYKETMVDTSKLVVPDVSVAVGAEGNFLEHVSTEVKEILHM